MTKILVFISLMVLSSCGPAQAENLNRKFGPGWNCSYISFDHPGLNRDCQNCEAQGLEFDQEKKDGGRCRDKQSLRQSDYSEDNEEDASEAASGAARDRASTDIQRRGNMRVAPDSDVSGRR